MSNGWPGPLTSDDIILDSLPDDIQATVESRSAWLNKLGSGHGGLEFFVNDLLRWTPGQRVRVAFLGGDTTLHQNIADATKEITDNCNLTLDFGLDSQARMYRTWSTEDTQYVAEIRISFDQAGYFSLVGTDSANANIGSPMGQVGGRPNQRSLNLGGFNISLPPNWQGVTRHEFLHALAFLHTHQNMRGPCESQFRWDDDSDYVPTQDGQGRFVVDAAGRRPGIYTYLSGFPNFWSRQKVDFNLRTEANQATTAGPFDPSSVMLYRFPSFFYVNDPSSCAPNGEGISLSEGDRRGLQLLYPQVVSFAERIVDRQRELLTAIESIIEPMGGLEAAVTSHHTNYARNIANVLRNNVQ